ncbi:MAG: ArgE/DapE family deacylase [Furfurilactobacillus sp.]|jgi:succinyl-diaminopimelate desuccinylase|uniref:Probable succinyl-diaminopimelate desuccinylase n=1 Tax=Furfurilactobacillus milii TaxID=2888272 RepID=A0ABT6DBY5_9LACO|nr:MULTISPECIES: ArgE/DapE family deacylase [Furfurilactobacillus]QLE66418.1 Acetylornithine deacetylase [Furfurilactobacillus rossiae]MCF6159874.1 ArgE/DapE family deacylase [Furfurilactobacillus milii]MCF6162577.1 ArgE/DapE family deacylase [Furfurilactobacillus milii]MCF6419252.1 ArgE/DapE family deacylase [Furfurilactobacillus milii]MCH4010872.1 ArgE/DapE family deacylase [Furfurilactobacillus sp.]
MEDAAALKILTDLIAIPSVNDRESEVADYLAGLFKDLPAHIERVTFAPGRDNLVVTIGDHGPLLGFSGHEDVVAAGNEADWTFPPFAGTIDQGNVYGRGASDMKSGLAAQVVAMLDLLNSNQPLPGRLRLLASVGEETGEYGAAQLTQQGYANDLDGLVIGEPSAFDIKVTHKGVIDYKVTSLGKGSHSSRPDQGINAITPLLKFAEQAESVMAANDKRDDVLGGLTHVISQIGGGEQINSVPANAWLTGNIRTIPAYPNDEVMAQLEDIIESLNQAGAKLSISYSYPEPPLPSQAGSKLAKITQAVLKNTIHRGGELTAGTGATDASEYTKAGQLPIVIVGPAAGTTDHQVNENVVIDDYLTGCHFYRALAEAFWAQAEE